jgi:rod shape-determining protein MreD
VEADDVTDWVMIARWTVLVVTTTILQIGLAPQFPVFGVVADLMLTMSIAAGIAAGPQRGAIVGFWLGLFYDAIRPELLGLSALTYALVAYGVGSLLVAVITVRRVLAAIVMFVASAVGVLGYAVVAELFGQHTLTNDRLFTIMFVVALVAAVLSPLLVPVARWAEGEGAIEGRTGVLERIDG